ncbi:MULTISPECIES: nucleotide pyrophosphohydrolase [unclassified Arcicella]|uniref:nucleotide pyrophosphohydrolase n=1 Tax=unclassified Arcicella TaxID=2644986 RepID=UPI00286A99F0|nr:MULTISPECIES: nucleotide pyrophosphohydrolase [unclassified Arcicella]
MNKHHLGENLVIFTPNAHYYNDENKYWDLKKFFTQNFACVIFNVNDIIIMEDFNKTIKDIIKFRDERDWEQFHNSKDLAIALSIEASELLELFLWKNNEDCNIDKLKEELADVLMYAFLLANKHDLDINKIIQDKIQKNAEKYPVGKAKGNATKYNEL